MRVLLISQWFPPEPRELYLQLAQGFARAGHDVEVITGFPNWPGGHIYPGYRMRLFQREVIEGIRVTRLPLYPDHGQRAIKRALNLVSLAVSTAILAPWLIRRCRLVYVVQLPTVVLAARWLALLWRARVVMEIQDMWPETLESTGMLRSRRLLGIVSSVCGLAYRCCAAIRVISPGFKGNLEGKGVASAKVHVVHNWVEPGAESDADPDAEFAERYGTLGKFTVLYAGSIGKPQGLDVIIEAADILRARADVQFLVAGDGVERERLERSAAERGLTSVRFVGKLPQADVPRLYTVVNVLLVHLVPDPLFAITIPHKILGYLAAGKPILAGVEGDPRRVIEDAGAGIAFAPGDPAALAQAIERLASASPDLLAAYGRAGRRAAAEDYSAEMLIPRIVAMAERTVAA